MAAGRVRTGLVGYGYAGRTFHAPLMDAAPGLELVAVASSDPARVHADRPGLRVHADAQALASDDDIELVVVATPNAVHFPVARAALAAGRHVVVDKPLAVTLEESEALARLAAERGRLLSVFHNRRWDGDFLTLQGLVARGALGRVVSLEFRFDRFRPEVRARWREGDEPGAVRGRAPNPVPPHEAIEVMALLVAGIESDRQRRDIACGPHRTASVPV